MAIRTFTAVLALSMLAGSAMAAPVLRSDVVVTAPVVTVGDMFDDAGILAETAIFRAPEPGTSGVVDIAAVQAAATRIGLDGFDGNGLSGIRVSRAASTVDESLLKQLITTDLGARGILRAGMHAETRFGTTIDPILVAKSDAPAQLESLVYNAARGEFTARFLLTGINRPLDVSGRIDMTVDVPHLVGNLAAGTVLTASDIVLQPIPVAQADGVGVTTMNQLIGMALTRPSREGMLLKTSDVTAPLAVAKNDLVTIVYRRGPITLTAKGQAITSASQGGPLQVLNLMSKRVITGTAVAAGTVEVDAAPPMLAGL